MNIDRSWIHSVANTRSDGNKAHEDEDEAGDVIESEEKSSCSTTSTPHSLALLVDEQAVIDESAYSRQESDFSPQTCVSVSHNLLEMSTDHLVSEKTEENRELAAIREEMIQEIKRRGGLPLSLIATEMSEVATSSGPLSKFINRLEASEKLIAAISMWIDHSKDKYSSDAGKKCALSRNSSVLTCDICGRKSDTFSSVQGYYRHCGWCQQRKRIENGEVVVKSTKNKTLDISADSFTGKRKKKPVSYKEDDEETYEPSSKVNLF